MAMHVAYRFHRELAGVFALSSFLNDKSKLCTRYTWTNSTCRPIPPKGDGGGGANCTVH